MRPSLGSEMTSWAPAERGRPGGGTGYPTDGQSPGQARRKWREDFGKGRTGERANRKEDGPRNERIKLPLRAKERPHPG